MASWIPPELHGGIAGQGTETASLPVTMFMAQGIKKKMKRVGTSLDYVSCFDRIDPSFAIEMLRQLGLPEAIVEPLIDLYEQTVVYTRVSSATEDIFQPTAGIIQGCAMSTIWINAVMAIWVIELKHFMVKKHQLQVPTNNVLSIYLDDRNLVATSIA